VTRRVHLRVAGVHAEMLQKHLYPGDGKEAVAVGLCGRHRTSDCDVLLVQEIHLVPHTACSVREPNLVTWRTELLEPLLERAARSRLAFVKFHSHPSGRTTFSATDDASDSDLFASVYGWIDDEGPHASAVVLPDGAIFGRAIAADGAYTPLDQILVADHDLRIFATDHATGLPAHAERHAQLFGERTTNTLRRLSVGVVGCSGTGSFVIEMLARLGVSRLVLVDPDRVEHRNLNRIVGTTAADAESARFKVDVLGERVASMGLGTEVTRIPTTLGSVDAVTALAGCDVVFGCMDSHDGRQTLNRLACFYLLPYFDCGVGLRSDGYGGVDEVSVASHYVQPGRSTLLGRGAIRAKRAEAEAKARTNPEEYQALHAEGYIEGVEVGSPAVISINALAASLAVNEFLARLHPYRMDTNEQYASVRINVAGMYLDAEPEGGGGPLRRALGRGDVEPLLDMSYLSSRGR